MKAILLSLMSFLFFNPAGWVILIFWPLIIKFLVQFSTRGKKKVKPMLIIQPVWVIVLLILTSFVWLPLVKSCPQKERTFEYEGCSVNYIEIIPKKKFLLGECLPCAGIMPCISGFDHNLKVTILKCLCADKKPKAAKEFAREYMMVPGYEIGDDYVVAEGEIEDICNHIPIEQLYL